MPYDVVRRFEQELCHYTGAKYCVSTNSCTNAVQMSLEWFLYKEGPREVTVPRFTYVSIPQAVKRSGHSLKFEDFAWLGSYQLKPFPVWDSARLLTSGMYKPGAFICLSFHWSKHLQIGLGGAILHDTYEADRILRKMRFDGRTEGIDPKHDTFPVLGMHAYMTPGLAADGLMRLSLLPKHNEPLPNSDYADCQEKFRKWL